MNTDNTTISGEIPRRNGRDLLRQRRLWLSKKHSGYVLHFGKLLPDLGIHLLIAMPYANRENSAKEIEILIAIRIPHKLILGALHHQRFLKVMEHRRKQEFLLGEDDFLFCH